MKTTTALTTKNVNIAMTIENTQHPEWGTWTIMGVYDLGIYEIRGRSGDRVLFDSEFRFWNIVTD